MNIIAVYYRVSTSKQDLTMQRDAVQKWLKTLENKPKILEYVDDGRSGMDKDRPGLNQMLADAKARKFETIAVYAVDRLSRDISHFMRLVLDLDDLGIGFLSITQPGFNLTQDNAFRMVIISSFAAVAQVERTLLVQRIKDGLESAKERGVKLGRPAIDEDKAKIIKEHRKNGLPMRKIAVTVGVSLATVSKVLQTFNNIRWG